jgi:hypothetical protein
VVQLRLSGLLAEELIFRRKTPDNLSHPLIPRHLWVFEVSGTDRRKAFLSRANLSTADCEGIDATTEPGL